MEPAVEGPLAGREVELFNEQTPRAPANRGAAIHPRTVNSTPALISMQCMIQLELGSTTVRRLIEMNCLSFKSKSSQGIH
jgi:hypothetical protein